MRSHGASSGMFILLALQMMVTLSYATDLHKKIHESLSRQQLRELFHVDSHSLVPEYQLVNIPLPRLRRASDEPQTHRVEINVFNEKKVLKLVPNLHLAKGVKVFFADHDPKQDKVVVKPASSINEEAVGIPYQCNDTLSAVMVHKDPNTGQMLLDGTIGDDFVIKPLPSSVLDVIKSTESRNKAQKEFQREQEQDINSIRPPDDEAFMDNEKDDLEQGDLEFSDQYPPIADDHSETADQTRQFAKPPKKNLPDGLELLKRRRRAVSEREAVHIIFKRDTLKSIGDYELMESDKPPTRNANVRVKRSSRGAPSVIYPEILVLVDYDGYLLHGQDNTKIKSYYVSFWNGADLRYKLLSSPKVKISIAGIIISRGRDAMPYLERNRVGRDSIDSASALTDMGKYLFQERRLPTYDIAVAITKLDMCRRTSNDNSCNRGTAGFAYVGGACVVNKRLKKVNSVAIVEDTGGFSGIIVAAHEVGHLLGAVHDGSPPPSYLGGPGAKTCRWEDGYIMSDLRHTATGFKWSHCSIEQFHHFLNGDTATCLYNLPHEDESLPRILPGKLLSLDQQCRKDRGTSACFKDARVCAQLFCFDSQSGYCVSYRPAAEGSDCGSGKICIDGKCVNDNENSISDHNLHGSSEKETSISTRSTLKTTTTTKRPTTTTRRTTPRRIKTTTRKPTTRKPTTTTTTTTPKPTTPTTTTPKPPTTTTTTTTTTPKPTTTPRRTTVFGNGARTSRRTTSSISTTSRHTSVSTSTPQKPFNNDNIHKNKIEPYDADCRDIAENIGGNMSCVEFLVNRGQRYCDHVFIRQKCCKARKLVCKNFKSFK